MDTHTSTSKRLTDRCSPGDAGQAALVLVIAFTVMLTIFGGVMIQSIVNNAPIITQASIQRYAYRAMASGLNAYQNAINANPYLAACNSSTNYPNGANANSQCAGLSYQTWSQVPGTDVGNGVIPEYYKFDNPQQVDSSITKGITYLEVQIVGAAGFPGKNVFYSTIAKFTPQNGFLNAVWWSNYESFDPNAGGSAANCDFFYNQGRSVNTGNSKVGTTPCVAVNFANGDQLFGPVYTNDSIYIDQTGGLPSFTGTVQTADPNCLFVDYSSTSTSNIPGCNQFLSTGGNPVSYTVAGSQSGHTPEPLPTTNAKLAATAKQGGCYYQGPTTVTLSVTAGGVGQMSVTSLDTANTGGVDSLNLSIDTSTCRTDGTATALPANGVLYVDAASSGASSNNPFDSSTNGLSQVQSNCANCYYGQSSTPGTEADAFVSDATTNGGLSGHLTIGTYNNVIIDGPLKYYDCYSPTSQWVGTASQSLCNYQNSITGTNDVLGLIANNNVEVNRPVYNPTYSNPGLRGTPLPDCNGSTWVAPLCDPATATGSPTGGQGLTIDATILALNQSFAVNNYSASGNEGQLTVYGSIQQDARGAVGLVGGTGYLKYYLWDSRLTLYPPPYYLTPGTPSWALDSSASTYQGQCPAMPPPEPTPSTSQPPWPALGTIPGGWSACVSAS